MAFIVKATVSLCQGETNGDVEVEINDQCESSGETESRDCLQAELLAD